MLAVVVLVYTQPLHQQVLAALAAVVLEQ